jgi:hypothetical protein
LLVSGNLRTGQSSGKCRTLASGPAAAITVSQWARLADNDGRPRFWFVAAAHWYVRAPVTVGSADSAATSVPIANPHSSQ